MNRILVLLVAIASLSLLVGCQPKESDKPADETETTGSTTSGENPEDPGDEVPDEVKDDSADITAELKTNAFEYYGLDNKEPLTYTLEFNGSTEEGTQQVKYQGLVDGAPTYTIVRTGSLDQLGDETVAVKTDGVHLVKSSMGQLDSPSLALPADAAPGKKWTSTQSITSATGDQTKFTMNYEVAGEESVQTDAGEFDCIVVKSTGTLQQGEVNTTFSGTVWHSKSVGTVKLTLDTTDANGDPAKAVITLIKKGA